VKDLSQITVVGLGLLGGSISLAVERSFTRAKTVGYTHRAVTRRKARQMAVAGRIAADLKTSVAQADIVILATPIFSFDKIFSAIAQALPTGCIVTDVGSTKLLPHRWARQYLPKTVYYVGSHPIAGSEQRGIEFARDDLFDGALCILTMTEKTNPSAVKRLKEFWTILGCRVKLMAPREHDRIFAAVSHLPHIAAAALINANSSRDLEFAGKGFMDTSRIASGPPNIWSDVLLANASNLTKEIDRMVVELLKLRRAVSTTNGKQILKLLKAARDQRAALIKHKIKNKEIIS
jgi:prephenate dehydrogenase